MDVQGWITNDKLEEHKLNFPRCVNRDIARTTRGKAHVCRLNRTESGTFENINSISFGTEWF